MRSLTLLLALGLVSTEKLDRTYLPPPGSKFSGGDPGDLQVPFEFPKEAYSTTAPFTQVHKDEPSDTQLTTGFDRQAGLTKQPGPTHLVTAGATKPPFNYSQNIYNLPTTTTSYAFTQTTTYPPSEDFKATVSPLPGFPDSNIGQQQPGFINYPHGQSHIFNEQGGQNFPIIGQPGRPVPTPISNNPNLLFSVPGQIDGRPGFNQPQEFIQYQQNLPSSTASTYGTSVIPGQVTSFPYNQGHTQHLGVQPPNQQETFTSSTIAPTYQTSFPSQLGNVQSPGTPATIFQQGQYPSQFPGQQQTLSPTEQPSPNQYVDKFGNLQGIVTPNQPDIQQGGQRPLFGGQPSPQPPTDIQTGGDLNSIRGVVPVSFKPNQLLPTPGLHGITFTGQPSQSQYAGQQGTLPPFSETLVPGQGYQQVQSPGQQGSFSSAVVQPSPGSIIQPQKGQQNQYFGQQGTYPSRILPDRIPPIARPGSQLSNIGSSNLPKSAYTGQQTNIIPGTPTGIQQISGSNEQTQLPYGGSPSQPFSTPNSGFQNVHRPGSTLAPDYNQRVFPSSTATPFPSYGTTPSSNYPTFTPGYQPSSTPGYQGTSQDIPPQNIRPRPERPQAEYDRNAVILNYKNELTPEGFSYSFDTSNGIHADENGTAIDGVKAEGSYSYIGDDGKVYNVVYTADENGFRPHGDHIPTPPPVPEAIQRVIEQAERDKEAGITHDGSYDEAKYGHNKYQGPRRRPQHKDKTITNGVDIPDEYDNFDEKGNKELYVYQDGKKHNKDYDSHNRINLKQASYPTNKKIPSDNVSSQKPSYTQSKKDGYESEDEYDEFSQDYKNRRPPGSKTGFRNKYIPEGSVHKNKGEYDTPPEIEEKLQEKSQGVKKGNLPADKFSTKVPSFQYSGTKTRPRPDASYRGSISKTPQSFKHPVASGVTDDVYTQRFDDVGRPTKPTKGPLRPYGTSFSDSDETDKFNEKPDKQGRIPDLKNKYTSQRRPMKPSTEIHDPQIGRRPPHVQQSIYPQQSIDYETGYYYTPPQNKFEQGTTTAFPSRLSESAGLSTKRPSTKYNSIENKSTVKPFMTPNVYQEEDKSFEDISDEKYETSEPDTYSETTSPYEDTDYGITNDGPEYFDKDIELDIGDDEITATRVRPGKPESVYSARRPSYPTQKTGINRPNSYKKITSASQDNILEDREEGTKSNYDVPPKIKETSRKPSYVPSTTSMPSRRPIYDATTRSTIQPSRTSTLESDYSQETDQPGISKTRPTHKSRNKPQGYSDVTITTHSEADSSSSRIPSTRPTSRPVYPNGSTITGSTAARPSTFGDVFRTPSSKPEDFTTGLPSSTIPASITVYSQQPTTAPFHQPSSVTFSPGSTGSYSGTNYPGRIVSTAVTQGLGLRTPGQSLGTQILPSTTYRPNYSSADVTQPGFANVDTFGRPITGQPGLYVKHSPEFTAFTAQNQSQPGLVTVDIFGRPTSQPTQAAEGFPVKVPGLTVDAFGRPVNLPGQENQGIGSTTRPNYTVVTQGPSQAPGSFSDAFGRPITQSGQTFYPGQTIKSTGRPEANVTNPETGLPSTVVYQDSGLNQPSRNINVFKPTQSRFGSSTPGPKPIDFGPSNVKTPAYLGPVVGEDFSGPKQPQRFDPETGYHY